MFRSRHILSVVLALAAGAALRFYFIHAFPVIQGDSLLYGAIAENWLSHGVYGFSMSGPSHLVSPTLIRLPGYPAFLALCFQVFGLENYRAVLYLQAAIDLAGCLFVAAFVRRLSSARAALIALWLAVLCPFTANYAAMPLTETLSIFCIAAGFYAFVRLLENPGWRQVLTLAILWSYCALLRPDGALLAIVLFFSIIAYGPGSLRQKQERCGFDEFHKAAFFLRKKAVDGSGLGNIHPVPALGLLRSLRIALTCTLLSLLPFAIWTFRNWRTFHVFQPLAPRSAADPGEFAGPGFDLWTKTWLADFTSTYEIYWNVPGDDLDIAALPSRAFDNHDEYQQTRRLFALYNVRQSLTPRIDAGFARLAWQRIRAHPMRFYVTLPLLRLLDMWLRPRVEMLNVSLRWQQYSRHRAETLFALGYGALGWAYLIVAISGAFYWPRYRLAMLAYIVLRSLLLLTVGAPEPRYTLECFPLLFAFAAQALDHWASGFRSSVSGYRYNEGSNRHQVRSQL